MSVEQSKLEQVVVEAGGPAAFAALVQRLSPADRQRYAFDWSFVGRPSQQLPPGDWNTACWLQGRGAGKTRTLVENARIEIEAGRATRVAVVAPTSGDLRRVLVEGETGFLRTSPPWNRPTYEPSLMRLRWDNGAVAFLYSAEEADRLRGPAHDLAVCDEAAVWPRAQEVWDMLQFGLRLGPRPRALLATTPRPIGLLKKLINDPSVVVVRGRTTDNAANLPPAFLEAVLTQYSGTRIGRAELDGELLDDVPGALWRLDDVERSRIRRAPETLLRTVIGIDPAVSANKNSDETGIIVAALFDCACQGRRERHAVVLQDVSGVYTPSGWARAVQLAYARHAADLCCAESNNGGLLVAENLRANSANLPLKLIHASKAKSVRAEPIASFYERGMIHHLGVLADLETQMTTWSPLEDSGSPDRVDALCYALSELMLTPRAPHYQRRRGPPIFPPRM